jgi:hypothetical protein
MFTPNKAQHNSMIEHVFIMEKIIELEKAKEAIASKFYYHPGNILLCHIPTKEHIHAKRRRNFDTLATFVNYSMKMYLSSSTTITKKSSYLYTVQNSLQRVPTI